MATQESYRRAYSEFIRVAEAYGLPAEVGKMIADQLQSEIGLRRMTSYIRNARPTSMEQIADEVVAIMEDRHAWIRKKQAEESNSRYTAWLNSDRRGEE